MRNCYGIVENNILTSHLQFKRICVGSHTTDPDKRQKYSILPLNLVTFFKCACFSIFFNKLNMAESTHKAKQKCKGCNFLIKSDKLLVHLNHPKVKCKEAYSKDEYSLVYDLWMQTKMAIRIQDQDKIKCRGCNFNLDKFNLLWHLNDKKVDCKKIYSKDEYQHIFEFWLFHKENPSKPPKTPFEDDPCDEMMECEECKKMFIGGELLEHVRNSDACRKKYLPRLDGLIDLEKRYSLLKEEEENEKVKNHYFKNVVEQEHFNLSETNSPNGKPFFLEYGAIEDFVLTAYETRRKLMPSYYGTIGVLLGVEDDYGYHGKELIYLPDQEPGAYWTYFDEEGFNVIKNSRTFKNHPRSARVLVWMTTGSEGFTGYAAHTQANTIKYLSKCAITLTAKVSSDKMSKVGEYGLYELNDQGIQSVRKCTYKQKKKKDTFMCCEHHYKKIDASMFHHKQVILTYSTIIAVKDKRDREIYYRTSKRKTIPALFDPKNFAKIDPTSDILDNSDMKANEIPGESDFHAIDTDGSQKETNIDNVIPIEVCKTCNKQLKINTIMKHLSSKSPCIKSYSHQDLKVIRRKVTDFRNKNRRIKHSEQKESSEEVVYCKICHSKCYINTIKYHLAKYPTCQKQYSKDDLKSIDLKCENYQKAKKCKRENDRNNAKPMKDDGVRFFYILVLKSVLPKFIIEIDV